MQKLIDADALVENLTDKVKGMAKIAESSCGQAADYYSGIKTGFANAAIVAYSFPTTDAVPVVRCKDCKHRDTEDGLCKGRGWQMQLVPDDGFCDKGERSEECD